MGLFDIRKGVVGNIENALLEILHANNNLAFEQRDRTAADTENREAVEQSMTDYELDMIQTQQDLTDLQIQILEGAK